MPYRLLSKLLDYPDAELLAALPEVQTRLKHLDTADRRVLETFVAHLDGQDLTRLQAGYVMTFDLTPSHSLHLTHHLFGDDKNRGPALIDLTEFYKEYGLEMAANELPDYLPLALEFAAGLEPEEAAMFLAQWTRVFHQLADNLEAAESPYAPLIRLLEQHSQLIKAAA